jgi:hypothetical protein
VGRQGVWTTRPVPDENESTPGTAGAGIPGFLLCMVLNSHVNEFESTWKELAISRNPPQISRERVICGSFGRKEFSWPSIKRRKDAKSWIADGNVARKERK